MLPEAIPSRASNIQRRTSGGFVLDNQKRKSDGLSEVAAAASTRRRSSLIRFNLPQEEQSSHSEAPFRIGRHDTGGEDSDSDSSIEEVPNRPYRLSGGLFMKGLSFFRGRNLFIIALVVCSLFLVTMTFKTFSTDEPIDNPIYHRILREGYRLEKYQIVQSLFDNTIHLKDLKQQLRRKDHLDITVEGKKLTIDLLKDELIYTRNYEKLERIATIRKSSTSGRSNCVYRAQIRGDPHSYGTASLCHGEIKINMMHDNDPSLSFSVIPLEGDVHAVYHLHEQQDLGRSSCEEDEHDDNPKMRTGKQDLQNRRLQIPFPVGSRNKTLKVYIVNDAARVLQYGSTLNDHTTSLMSMVREYYTRLYSTNMYGIEIQIAGQLDIVGIDPWPTDSNLAPDIINRFYEWKLANPLPEHDVLLLFSGRFFANGVVGRAARGGVCNSRNVAIMQIADFNDALYAKIITHEIAHTLSLPHDDTYTLPACIASPNTNVWSAISYSENTFWTSCAIENLKYFFDKSPSYPFDYLDCMEQATLAPAAQNAQFPSPTSLPTSKSPTTSSPTSAKPTSRSPTSLPTSLSPTTARPTSRSPSNSPIETTTRSPTSKQPTRNPSLSPVTGSPTSKQPTRNPSMSPVTRSPTSKQPTRLPSLSPVTRSPTSKQPTRNPSMSPVSTPTTKQPTQLPSLSPVTRSPTSKQPTQHPSGSPVTKSPTSKQPTQHPSGSPVTKSPTSKQPTNTPSNNPSIPVRIARRTLTPTSSSITPSPTPTTLSPTKPFLIIPDAVTTEAPLSRRVRTRAPVQGSQFVEAATNDQGEPIIEENVDNTSIYIGGAVGGIIILSIGVLLFVQKNRNKEQKILRRVRSESKPRAASSYGDIDRMAASSYGPRAASSYFKEERIPTRDFSTTSVEFRNDDDDDGYSVKTVGNIRTGEFSVKYGNDNDESDYEDDVEVIQLPPPPSSTKVENSSTNLDVKSSTVKPPPTSSVKQVENLSLTIPPSINKDDYDKV